MDLPEVLVLIELHALIKLLDWPKEVCDHLVDIVYEEVLRALVHSLLLDDGLNVWQLSLNQVLVALNELLKHIPELFVDGLDAVHGDVLDLLRGVLLNALLLNLELLNCVEDANQVGQAALFYEVVEDNAA